MSKRVPGESSIIAIMAKDTVNTARFLVDNKGAWLVKGQAVK